MPFVSFSSQHVIDNTTAVSNLFMGDYLPVCNGDCARVYLYGLYLCGSATRYDNTLEHFSTTLGISKEDIISAFMYWQNQGLVQVLSIEPIEVKYLPIKTGGAKIKKYSQDKYADFNAQIQTILEGRMITPTEYAEYYTFLESFHVEPTALIMIAKYCSGIKGNNVGYAYILTVAKNWAYSGIKTMEAVTEKLKSEATDTTEVTKVLKALNAKRTPEPTDFELYTKWTRKLGYSADVIVAVAKNMSKMSKSSNITKLDATLLKYFELKLFELAEIKDYDQKKQHMFDLAVAINKKIGVYYENVENIIETYIVNWQMRGYDAGTLLEVASFCFKSGIRTLDGMDSVITKFYKRGITSSCAIDEFIAEKVTADKSVKTVLEKLNITRQPNQMDRDFYTTWVTTWGFTTDMINYATTLSADKGSAMQYMNKILSNWREQKITTLAAAKKTATTPNGNPKPTPQKQFTRHSYSDGELNRLFSNLDEVEF